MKKFLSIALAGLLFCGQALPALANGWGLDGSCVNLVSGTSDYDAYLATADDGDRKQNGQTFNHAILSSRYHNVLLALPGLISTKAVYQPGDERGRPTLEHLTEETGFRLSYPGEEYTFVWAADRAAYLLKEARFDTDTAYASSLMYTVDEYYAFSGYDLWQGGDPYAGQPIGDARWEREPITLEEFNIALLPRTMEDVRQILKVGTRLRLSDGVLTACDQWTAQKDGIRLPVYSAPDETSFRAAKGKAAVSTGGDMTILGQTGEWTLISYQVSQRTSRIGYVSAQLLEPPCDLPLSAPACDLFALRDTYLTDDPDVSQYPQVSLPAGARMTGLAAYGPFYAYVEYEADGMLYRGFVPLKDLTSPASEQDLSVHDTKYDPDIVYRWDVADRLVGKWDVLTASDRQEDWPRLILYSGGGYDSLRGSREAILDLCGFAGIWRIEDADETDPWAGAAPYTLTFIDESNQQWRWGLVIDAASRITLMNEETTLQLERTEFSTWGNG